MRLNVLVRKLHSWGSIIIALPILVVICSGVLLQLKKQVAWVQPPEQRGVGTVPAISWDQMLAATASAPGAEVRTWDDVRRVDVRPDKGVAKVWTQSGYEVQVDLETARVLQSAYRRSDLIESIHDGSFFHEHAKLWLFLPAGLVLLGLWVTGIYLFVLPYWARRKRAAAPAAPRREPAAARRTA
jgi:uncharacterized iron-regulated membrane protein